MARKIKLNPLDASWLMVESTETPMHVGSLTIYSLPPKAPASFLKDWVAAMREHRNFAAPFNLKLANPSLKAVLPAWVEDHKIDLDYHLRHSALPAPGGERELGVLISRLHSHALDFNRPLWEMHIIEGLENNRFALYMKMHHSQVDGVGGMKMLEKMLSPDANAEEMLPPWSIGRGNGDSSKRRGPKPTLQEQLKAQASTLPGVMKALREVVGNTFNQKDAANAAPFVAPKSILNRKIGGQRRFATQFYELARIKEASKTLPIVFASNFSVGVNTLFWLTRHAARILTQDRFDIEVTEMHHKHKIDAPSGTARRILEILNEETGTSYEDDIAHGRFGNIGPRKPREIGMHTLRGGDVVGDHTVIFAADGERVELTHKASSRDTFANGAVRSAVWLAGQKPGLYSMQDVLGLK